MMWRLPELLLFSAMVVCLIEHLMLVFCYRSYFLWGMVLYRQTLLAPSVSVALPTAERLKDDLETLGRTLVVKDLGGGLFGIHASHGYCLVHLFDLLHASLRFQPDTTSVTLTGRCYWAHLIFVFLGLTVAVEFQNPIILVVLSVAYFVRYFFHRRTFSVIGEVAVRAWSDRGC